MASKITASVGRKGKNIPEDVKTVQTLLNAFAAKAGFAKLKPDGTVTPKLEQAIGTFQQEVCGFKPDCRIDPGKATFKKLAAGPAKAESEHKAEVKKVKKALLADRDKLLAKVMKEAEAQAKAKGMPQEAARALYQGIEQSVIAGWDAAVDTVEDVTKLGTGDVTKLADQVFKTASTEVTKAAGKLVAAQAGVMKALQGAADKAAKTQDLAAKTAKDFFGEVEQFASDQWAWLTGKDTPEEAAKKAEKMAREAAKAVEDIVKKIDPGSSEPDEKVPLTLKAAEVDAISSTCFTFSVSGKSPDPKSKVLLCLNKKENSIDITKGYTKAMLAPLMKLIDNKGLWGQKVDFFAMETTNGKPDEKTKSNVVTLSTPVEPFKGTISYTGLGADSTLKYTGNGKGRVLYYTKINGWYFFKYGGKFERDPAMRGFDCITYVGTANWASSGMNARGDKLASTLGASQVDMEDKTKAECQEYFKNDGKSGTYIAWWKTHCIVVINGTVHEWSLSGKGYRTSKASSFGFGAPCSVRKL